MADKHPYVPGISPLIQALDQVKKSFPPTFDAEILKKLGIAPNYEGTVLNVMRFLGLIDDQNKRTEKAQKIFTLHDQGEFQNAFSEIISEAYGDLFSLHGQDSWTLEQPKLITFFRRSDQSTERVGTEQARTFKTLARYAGHGDLNVQPRTSKVPKVSLPKSKKQKSAIAPVQVEQAESQANLATKAQVAGEFGLTVRIEINLPVADDQETYDRIFKSIRENLLNG